MENNFSVGGRKKVDVAIFHHGSEHTLENLSRVVICRPEPKVGKNAVRIRDFKQAAADLDGLENIMREVEAIQYGLWTNVLEFFFLEKKQKRFETKCNPIGDWPMAEESIGTKDVVSDAHTRVADNEMLKVTFRRCHNFIHGNEGMPKDAAFWQFLYLIFCKMHDESLRAKQRQGPGDVVSGPGRGNSSKTKAAKKFVSALTAFSLRSKNNTKISSGAMKRSPYRTAPWHLSFRSWPSTTSLVPTWTPRVWPIKKSWVRTYAVTGASISRLAVW